MFPRRLLLLLASSLVCRVGLSAQYTVSQTIESSSGNDCCDALYSELPSLVFARDTAEYNDRHTTYYSLQQQELFPNCTVKPNSPSDVSRVLQIAQAGSCPFAVASGGHMSWKGSSNLHGGFVIDMRSMNQIDISPQDQTVKLGPGSPWTNVYAAMAPFNVTTTGARINSVGVGGFLLGGGIAFASVDKGFGANNVFNYEVVLSNGTIVSASQDNNPDLFWALKLAGTNYGIVTRYDMTTYPSPAIWGAVTAYPITNQSVSDLLADYEQYGHDNTNTKDFKSFAFAQSNGTEMISTVEVNIDGVPRAPATSVEPLSRTEKVGNTHDVVNDVIADALAATARTHWYTFTTKIDSDYFQDLYAQAVQIFKPLDDCQGLTWTVGLQALQKSFIVQTAGTPIFNALQLPNDDLVFILLLVTWEDPSDELVLRNATDALGAWGEAEALRRDLLADFIYLNYANEEQRIYERSVTEEDLDKMRDLQNAYDPLGTFVKLWRGGYKIPEKSFHGAETGTGAAETNGGL